MNTVLIIDDEEKLRSLLARIISLEGFEVIQAGGYKSALSKIEKSDIDVVVCDVKLPDGNGLELAEKIKAKRPFTEIILLTAYGNIPDSVQAIKNGVFNYITKGDDNNRIIPLLHRASEKVELAKRIHQLEKQLENRYSFDNIIGKSASLQQAVNLARVVAPTDAAVLLSGETGTGKEVFAQAIHQGSPRKNQNFIAINCSAFNKDLLESEMFGHTSGSFTGAYKNQTGVFEEANNGTIFLDEISEMSLELQVKLLRVLESGEFIRIGENHPSKANVRIIAATNCDLSKEIEAGNFREDLFYRISVFQINLPPLRERVMDIEPLAKHFIQQFSLKTNKKITGITSECIDALKLHSWNGNIRELKNVIERSVILTTGQEINIQSLPIVIQQNITSHHKEMYLSAFDLASAEKLHIQKVLNYTNGNKTEAARLLNIALTTLYRKLEEYNIS